jgi:WD40 repeat protein
VARFGTTRFRTGAMVTGLTLSPDGKKLITNGATKGLFVFDAATGKRLLNVPGSVGSGEISHDGKRLLCLEYNQLDKEQRIKLYSLADGKLLKTIEAGGIAAFALAPDDRTLVVESVRARASAGVWSYSSRLELRDLTSDRVLHAFGKLDSTGPHHILRFSPDGKTLYAISTHADRKEQKSLVRRFDTAKAELKSQMQIGRVHYMDAPVWDGKSLLATQGEIWDLEKARRHWASKGDLAWIHAFVPGKQTVLGIAGKGNSLGNGSGLPLVEWDLEGDREVRRFEGRGESQFVVARDGKSVFGGNAGVSLYGIPRWDLATGAPWNPDDLAGFAWRYAFSPDNKYLAALCHQGRLLVYERATGKVVRRQSLSWLGPFLFTPDSKTLLAPGNGNPTLFDAASWKPVERPFEELNLSTMSWGNGGFTLSPDGKILAGCVPPQANFPIRHVHLWDLAGGKLLGKLKPTDDANVFGVSHPCFSPDGKRLACRVWLNKVPPDDQRLQVWNVTEKKLLATWSTPRQLTCLQFVEDGEFLAGSYLHQGQAGQPASDRDMIGGHIRICNASTGKDRSHFKYPTAFGFELATVFSPDGKLAATANRNSEVVSIWRLADGKAAGQFRGDGEVQALAFSQDSRFLAVSGADACTLLVEVTRVLRKR